MKPFISVIVIAHDRKQFLPDALRSLEAQTLSKDLFEVIVVKNFVHEEIDKKIRENGWLSIITNKKHVAGKIAVGLDKANGEIVTFLEDDDIYKPNRLEKIYQSFIKYPNIIFFHNSFEEIDIYGNSLGIRPATKYGELILPSKLKSKFAEAFDELSWASMHNSSIAIRRGIVMKYIDKLEN